MQKIDETKESKKLIGFLFDVSQSMQACYNKFDGDLKNSSQSELKNETRYQTVIDILERLIGEESIKNERFFSLAFGTKNELQICDLVSLIKDYYKFQNEKQDMEEKIKEYEKQNIDYKTLTFDWIKSNGAPNIEKFYSRVEFESQFNQSQTKILYYLTQNKQKRLKKFIKKLPQEISDIGFMGELALFTRNHFQYVDNKIKKEVKESVDKLQELIDPKDLSSGGIIKKLKIDEIKQIKKDRNFKDVSQNLLEKIAYQSTPLQKTMSLTADFLKKELSSFKFQKTLLFIVSDGGSTDGDPVQFANKIKSYKTRQEDVLIISCYISNKENVQSKQLYFSEENGWDDGAKTMFRMSSEVSNFDYPLSFLARNTDFKLSTAGKSRLFIQVNDPKVMKQFFEYMIKIREQTDTLIDLIGNINLEPYIKSSSEFEAREQKGGTCYANAIAAVYQMAMKRIFDREGGYPDFDPIRAKLIDQYKSQGANTEIVMKETCKSYRLQFKKLNAQEAKHSLHCGRPLVARFRLCDKQWDQFGEFYRKNPKGILQTVGPKSKTETSGHAVVLVGYGEDHLRFLNSWGTTWADQGFFRVKDETVLNQLELFDVYWTLDDLLLCEKQRFKENSARLINEHTKRYKDIFENVDYTCPLCKEKSPIKQYNGSIYETTCPKCLQSFHPQSLGQTFMSYIYGESI